MMRADRSLPPGRIPASPLRWGWPCSWGQVSHFCRGPNIATATLDACFPLATVSLAMAGGWIATKCVANRGRQGAAQAPIAARGTP